MRSRRWRAPHVPVRGAFARRARPAGRRASAPPHRRPGCPLLAARARPRLRDPDAERTPRRPRVLRKYGRRTAASSGGHAMASSSASSSSGSANAAAATFSRRCATDEVPGIRRMLSERCSSQASATASGVASRRAATASSVPDCSGVNPPSGSRGRRRSPGGRASRSGRRPRGGRCCSGSARRRPVRSTAPRQAARPRPC